MRLSPVSRNQAVTYLGWRLARVAGACMPHRTPPLILIAADDQAVCEALQFALRLEGLSVRTHRDADGLLADAGLPDAACIILDDRKPHLDGFDLIARLRARAPPVPVILLTGHATKRVRSRAANAGVQIVLEKPLLDNVLVSSIRTLLGNDWGMPH
jgi:FixJ family two-component response regulator